MNFNFLFMKIYPRIIIVVCFLFFLFSCTTHDKFNGTPVDNKLVFETITGTVSSPTTFALPGQSIDFTTSLPQEFVSMVNDTLDVEAITTTLGGSIRKSIVRFLPGISTVSSKILVGGGGGTFNMPVDLKLNAIALKNAFPGKQFLLKSNILTLDSGVTSVPTDNDTEFQVKIEWENLTVGNNIKCNVARVNSTAVSLFGKNAASKINIKYNNVNYLATYDTDLSTTASAFVALHSLAFLANNIELEAVGKSIIFKSSTVSPSITLSTVAPNTSGNLNGKVFNVGDFAGNGITSRSLSVRNSQSLNKVTSNDVEQQTTVFNPGNYRVFLTATSLEQPVMNLKYRIIIKQPNGEVTIFNDIYNGLTTTSAPKDILTFTKTGIEATSQYINITKL